VYPFEYDNSEQNSEKTYSECNRPLSETSRIYLHFLIDSENLVIVVMGRAVHFKTKGGKVHGIHSISRRVEKFI
jgi:hypothetical protein